MRAGILVMGHVCMKISRRTVERFELSCYQGPVWLVADNRKGT